MWNKKNFFSWQSNISVNFYFSFLLSVWLRAMIKERVIIIALTLGVIFFLGAATSLPKGSQKSDVSIICPVKDSKTFQEKLLPSLMQLSKKTANVLIVTDEPESMPIKAPHLHVIGSKFHRIYDGFDSGIKISSTPYVVLFTENDQPQKDYIERIVTDFKKNPRLVGVCPSYVSLKGDQKESIERHPFLDLLSGSQPLVNGCAFQRNFLQKFNIRFNAARAASPNTFFTKLLNHHAQIKVDQGLTLLRDSLDSENTDYNEKATARVFRSFHLSKSTTSRCSRVEELLSRKDIASLLGTFNLFGIRRTYCPELKSRPTSASIPIGMSADDRYIPLVITSITSAMLNAWHNTTYTFYIMHPHDISEKSKSNVLRLSKKFPHCTIELIDMGEMYTSAPQDLKYRHITTPAYYRLSLPDLLPNIDKLIWLDGDTLVLEDLHQMFSIPMDGYYVKGFLDNPTHAKYNQPRDRYICDGVMLMNLAELRRDNVTAKFRDFIEKNGDKLTKHDQTVINVVCHDKIGALPPRFGLMNFLFSSEKKLAKYIKRVISPEKYSRNELLDASNNPAIIHFTTKPWRRPTWRFADLWMNYAKETDVYIEIMETFFK